jgi:hypothetical protein
MKRLAGLLALILAAPGLAHAATIAGNYSIRFTTFCQSIENEVFNISGGSQTTVINTIDEGKLVQSIGFIKFTPFTTGAPTGTVLANMTHAKGTLTILGLPGSPAQPGQPAVPDMTITTAPQSGTYTLTLATPTSPSKLVITFTGGKGAETFTAYLSKLNPTGVYGHVDFVSIDGNVGGKPNCSNLGSADLQ